MPWQCVSSEADAPPHGMSQAGAQLVIAASDLQEEIVAWVRRRSSAFSRGRSRFRGVSGQAGHWEARIGTFGDRKNVRCRAHPTSQRPALRPKGIAAGHFSHGSRVASTPCLDT